MLGRASLDNTYFSYSMGSGHSSVTAAELINTGAVSGKECVGEIGGEFWSDAESALTDYTVLGKITLNGELKEGEYDVGSNTRLSVNERKLYGEETDGGSSGENQGEGEDTPTA